MLVNKSWLLYLAIINYHGNEITCQNHLSFQVFNNEKKPASPFFIMELKIRVEMQFVSELALQKQKNILHTFSHTALTRPRRG